jgi:threonyl-tRNA synthetase
MMKVPYMAVIGKREAEQGSVAVRARGAAGKKQDILPLGEFIERVVRERTTRSLTGL